jgi:hypothetical protein
MARSSIAVPDVEDAVPVDDLIQNLKKDIETECRLLLQRAQVIQGAVQGGAFRFRHWEGKVTEIRKAQITTYNIKELKELRAQCTVISSEMEEFSKKLS